ncbi:hypothetical protein [Paenibacillus sp. DYY-L-2]|uniref:hypothetical protein n=1 Tax=Paenibacillus sp. DYY-L-2 TaxID=3447013 RepID=UPI003F50B8FF
MQKGWIRPICFLFILLLLPACGRTDSRNAEDWFALTWSGLAGCDSLSFRGNAAIYRGQSQLEETVNYSGQLSDHHQLTMRAVRSSTDSGVGNGGVQAAAEGKRKAYQTELKWNGSAWGLKTDHYDALELGMARINPLDQLEEIRSTSKSITSEKAAARGTRVLRIELDPKEAKDRLSSKLTEEMNAVKRGWKGRLSSVPADRRQNVERELEAKWKLGMEQLAAMLEQADAKAVYHLSINRNTGLPTRLTSETSLNYVGPNGSRENEVLYTDNRFENFR